MKKSLLFVFLVFAGTIVFAQTNKTEEEVWGRVETLTKAIFGKRDSTALLDLVSSKVSYGHSTGLVEDKPTMIKAAMANTGSYRDIALERVSISVDNNTALIRHNLRGVSIDAKGTEAPLNLHIMQVWKKEGGKWRIWGRQAVKIAPKS